MIASESTESARDNFGKFIRRFQPETKTLIRKLERIIIKLYIYICVCVCVTYYIIVDKSYS